MTNFLYYRLTKTILVHIQRIKQCLQRVSIFLEHTLLARPEIVVVFHLTQTCHSLVAYVNDNLFNIAVVKLQTAFILYNFQSA